MKSAVQFLAEHAQRARTVDAPHAKSHNLTNIELPKPIRDAVRRGWRIFPLPTSSLRAPVSTALLEAGTSDLSHLEELASLYSDGPCQFGLATGPQADVWAAQLDGQRGAAPLYALAGIGMCRAEELWDGQTLLSQGGAITYAYFKWPIGFSMRRPRRRSEPGLIIHGDGSWAPLPPSIFSGVPHQYVNDVEVAATPGFLLDLLFELPGPDSGPAGPPKFPPRPSHSGYVPGGKRRGDFAGKLKAFQQPTPVNSRTRFLVSRRR